jgi:predicted HNH restriction endonuclease
VDESLQKTVMSVGSWTELKQLEANARARGRLTPDLVAALRGRSTQLAIPYIQEKTGLQLSELTPAERKIVAAVAEYVGLMREQGKYPGRTLEQLRNRDLIGAAEVAVAKARPTKGYETLVEANLEDLSYEQIVVDHPEEFTRRAEWYSRRTLGLPNRWPEAPADRTGKTQQHTERLLAWLAERAAAGDGLIAPVANADAAVVLEFEDPAKAGRAAGNVQSRIDFACFDLNFPPLGLTAEAPYDAAWQDNGRSWSFPVAGMAAAARARCWTPEDFDAVARATRALPAKASVAWETTVKHDEARLRQWAEEYGSTELGANLQVLKPKELPNDDWIRDELILALDVYIRHRQSPPGKASPEIVELSRLLVQLGALLNAQRSSTYRNPNGVYMKIMNFRRMDPQYTASGKVGLGRGNKLEAVVWSEFASRPDELQEIAAAIRACIEARKVPAGTWTDEEEEQTATEGRLLTRMHRSRERDPKLAKRKKDRVLKETGKLACEACGTDSAEKYGEVGSGVIDAHHTKPLHTLLEPAEVALADLALLCASCHRVIHASRPWLSVEQLREAIVKQRQKAGASLKLLS